MRGVTILRNRMELWQVEAIAFILLIDLSRLTPRGD